MTFLRKRLVSKEGFSRMGAVQDSSFSLIFIMSFAIVAVLAIVLFTTLTPILTDAFSGSSEAVTIFTEWNAFLPGFFNWTFGILFVSLPLIGAGLALLVPTNNFWMWVYVALSIIVLALGWMLQSLWGWFTAPEVIGDAASTLSVANFVFNNYAIYSVLMVLIIGLVTYSKTQRQSVNFGGGFI